MNEKTSNQSRASRIQQILRERFAPTQLDLRDESHLHAGHLHKDPRGETETHFRLTIASPVFAHLSRVDRQRLVNQALAAEFASGLHALALKILV